MPPKLENIDQEGFVHLGDEGVLRSFGRDGSVLDYVQLSPQQIQDNIVHAPPKHSAHLQEVFTGIDGRDVADIEQLEHPGADIYPAGPFSLLDSSGSSRLRARNKLILMQDCLVIVNCVSTANCLEYGESCICMFRDFELQGYGHDG